MMPLDHARKSAALADADHIHLVLRLELKSLSQLGSGFEHHVLVEGVAHHVEGRPRVTAQTGQRAAAARQAEQNPLPQLAKILRLAMLLGGVGASVFLVSRTAVGGTIADYLRGANVERKKVVWPTRQESLQTTLVIAVLIDTRLSGTNARSGRPISDAARAAITPPELNASAVWPLRRPATRSSSAALISARNPGHVCAAGLDAPASTHCSRARSSTTWKSPELSAGAVSVGVRASRISVVE